MQTRQRRNRRTKSVGNGNGSFYRSQALGRYVYQYFDTHGKRQTLTQRKFESVTAFRTRVTDVKSRLFNGTYVAPCKDTFISILKRFVDQKYKDGITSDRSYRRDLDTIKQIEKTCTSFKDKPIQKITVEDIEECKEEIRQYSNNVINKIWNLINKTFEVATVRRKIQFNIMLDSTLSKPISVLPQKKVEALTIDEQNRLIDVLNNEEYKHKYRDIILLQLYTGMRVGEVLALTRDCINLNRNTITVYRTLTKDLDSNIILGDHTKTFKKTLGVDKGKRTFPMNDNVRSLIEKILNYSAPNTNGILFWDNKKQRYITPVQVNNYLTRVNKKYHITSSSLHTHRLRHTFITRCVESGMYSKVIQSVVGHTSGSSITDEVYTSVSDAFMARELEKIN